MTLAAVLAGVGWLAFSAVEVVRASDQDDRSATEAIVVLGAAQYDGRPSPVLKSRLDHALKLYRQKVSRRIVLTGDKLPGDRFTEAFAGYRYLTAAGVPPSNLTIVDDGTSTWESLAATRRVLRKDGVSDVVLVSDRYHSRRLLDIANELEMSAAVSPTSSAANARQMARESLLVAAGRVVGYRRLLRIEL